MARELELAKYLAIVRALELRFQGFTLQYIPRAENVEADELAKATANNLPMPNGAFYQVLQVPVAQATAKAFKTILVTKSEDWRQLIIDYINNVHHIEDEASTARMAVRARNYTLVEGILYKKGIVQTLLKCISQSEGKNLLQEIHYGSCGSHIGPRALSTKAIRQGFYWPTDIKDIEEIVKTCQACQSTSPHQLKPSTAVQLTPPIWPFQRLGINLVGPLPLSQGGTSLQ